MASEFLLAYRALLDLANDDPTCLAQRAIDDPRLQDACDRVGAAQMQIWIAERYSRERYAHDLPSREIAARRDFDARWKGPVAQTDRLIAPLLPSLGQSVDATPRDPETDEMNTAIEIANYHAAQFECLIDYARDRVSADEWDEFEEAASGALAVWDDLSIQTGFDLGRVLARLELVPFTLIPSDISKHHGSAEAISLFQRLSHAQRAFIFGCDLASIALQRAILEDVLRRNYRAEGDNLFARIESAHLPWGLKPGDLHSIRALGNDVLHAARGDSMEHMELVKRVVGGLKALRKLIEGAPTSGRDDNDCH